MLRAQAAGRSQVKNFWIGLMGTIYPKSRLIGKREVWSYQSMKVAAGPSLTGDLPWVRTTSSICLAHSRTALRK